MTFILPQKTYLGVSVKLQLQPSAGERLPERQRDQPQDLPADHLVFERLTRDNERGHIVRGMENMWDLWC